MNKNYLISDLESNVQEEKEINVYGIRLLNYLKKNRQAFCQELLMTDKLHHYLFSVGNEIEEKVTRLVSVLAETERVDEQLKIRDQLSWVNRMNAIKSQAEEIVFNELFY